MSGVDRFWGPRRLTERRGWGLSPWKHPPWMITSRVGALTRDEQKKKKKNRWKGPVFDTVLFFFPSFYLFFLKCSFWVVCGCCIFRHYSHQQAWSTVTQKRNVYVSSVKMPPKTKKKKKKRHCIFTSRSLGRLFSGSPHSLHTWVSHGSVFSWSVTWLVIYWYPRFRFKNHVCV